MIAAVRGKLEWMGPDSLLIDISGVSLRLFVPVSILDALGPIGSDLKLYTHLHFNEREGQLILYGFKDPDQLALFDMLLGVAGVGPRAVLNVLSNATTEAVQLAIAKGDADFLKKVPGIGAKTASRIILELKGKLVETAPTTRSGGKRTGGAQESPEKALEKMRITEALSGLGYTSAEIQTALGALPADQNLSLEEQVLAALRYLGQ
ncbi:MAG: Holliday junction branch migration protein RuvA [Chloroflexi bacterium]|nr:Holliday junction branch migration protein RuvA [Chloroflexota bacterium]OJW03229.1 MAG: Holliday junction DNA helicase RuvA [Chloroflexi bacterium 54-19]